MRLFILAILSVLILSCDTTNPDPISNNIQLAVIDAGVREVYLNIKIDSNLKGSTINLERDGKIIMRYIQTSTDTSIADTGLVENSTYSYQAKILHSADFIDFSNKAEAKTLSPSSQEFIWETFLFGERSSAFYDVAIIDENNIWCVGRIYFRDSTGQIDDKFYNLARWNGTEWRFDRIYYYENGKEYLNDYNSIFAFSKDEIVIGGLVRWKNNRFESVPIDIEFNSRAYEIWGVSSEDYYIIGLEGNIAHYSNGNWNKIEPGYNWDFYDIHGYINPLSSKLEILCPLTDFQDYSNSTILKITDGDNVENINPTISRLIGSAWTNSGFPIYTSGDGLFTNKSGKWEEIKMPVNYVTTRIKGNGLNDIMVCGGFGFIAHFNGLKWKIFDNVYNAIYTSVNIKKNVAAFVGWRNNKAVITIGKR